MNIRLRLTLWYTAVLTLILVVFSAAVYLGLSQSLFLTLDNQLKREAGQIIGSLKFEGEDSEHDEDEHETEYIRQIELSYRPEEGLLWRILDTRGRRLVDPGYLDGVPIDPALAAQDHTRLEYARLANGTPVRLYSVPFIIEGKGAGLLQVGESYQHIQEVQGLLVTLFAIGLPFTILAVSAGGWFLAAGALNPIDRITRAAQQISADDLHRRLNLKLPNDEVGRLAVTFDQMLSRLDEAFERQKRFIADASHEMRTPLTILKGDVEVALNRPRTVEEYRETLEMVNETADRLTALVEELLLLARADNHQFPLNLASLNLADLLTEQVSRLLPLAVGQHITLSLDVPETLSIVADAEKLARLFMNLIGNAIKHSNPGDAVCVAAKRQNDHIVVTVTDTGPGIPAEHLSHLFERFYRVDKARSRQSDMSMAYSSGAGLGLSIARWLVTAHGGRIEVSSQLGRGTTFTVWLPQFPINPSQS